MDERATLARTEVPLVDVRGTRDRLVRANARAQIVAQRNDTVTADVEGPHALLYTRPAECWPVIQRGFGQRDAVEARLRT